MGPTTMKDLEDEMVRLAAEIDDKRAELKKLCAERDEMLLRAEVEAMDPAAREKLKRALGA